MFSDLEMNLFFQTATICCDIIINSNNLILVALELSSEICIHDTDVP